MIVNSKAWARPDTITGYSGRNSPGHDKNWCEVVHLSLKVGGSLLGGPDFFNLGIAQLVVLLKQLIYLFLKLQFSF